MAAHIVRQIVKQCSPIQYGAQCAPLQKSLKLQSTAAKIDFPERRHKPARKQVRLSEAQNKELRPPWKTECHTLHKTTGKHIKTGNITPNPSCLPKNNSQAETIVERKLSKSASSSCQDDAKSCKSDMKPCGGQNPRKNSIPKKKPFYTKSRKKFLGKRKNEILHGSQKTRFQKKNSLIDILRYIMTPRYRLSPRGSVL